MNFTISPDFTPMLSKLMERRTPVALSRLGGAQLPPTWKSLNDEVGLAGLCVDESHGGQGATIRELGAAAHEAGRVGWSGPLVATAGVATALLRRVDPTDATGLQARLASGERVAVVTLHEDARGAELSLETIVSSSATREAVLTGKKSFVDSGSHADTLLVPAVTADRETVIVQVPANATGVRIDVMPAVDEGRGLATIFFDETPGAVIATASDVADVLDDAYLLGALLVSADAIGAAGRCMELSTEYSMTRQQFGRPIATFQSIKHKLVDMFTELETARSAVKRALDSAADDAPDWRFEASAAKVRASDAAMHVAREAVEVHGGIGFTFEHELSHHFRRITTLRAVYGTPTAHRARVATARGF